jgi:Major Facilitator Superfamily
MASQQDDLQLTRSQLPPKVDENTPLLPTKSIESTKSRAKSSAKSVLFKLLLCGFFVSLSFGVTQVPLIYVFRLMTCEAYYENPHHHPPADKDRCSVHAIESGTAKAVALLSGSTTLFGVINLFVTTWSIKRFGIKTSLAIQVFWPAVRLTVQNIGVMVGSDLGILIIQCSQIITIVGGPAGYLLSLNSFVAEVVEHSERTGTLGRLQGCTMFGTAIGYLAGGLISDAFSIIAPFRVTLTLFLLSTLYVLVFLPGVSIEQGAISEVKKKTSAGGTAKFFGPLKIFLPQKWILQTGHVRTEYGALILGLGVFFGVLATGYIPVLLQMYSTDVLGFKTTENSILISLNSMLRGLFLTLAFPRIIKVGRKWIKRKDARAKTSSNPSSGTATPANQEEDADFPTQPQEFAATEPMDDAEEPVEPIPIRHRRRKEDEETFAFDLLFTRWSLLVDGVLTGLATFAREGWQIYVVAVLLPFASGTGSSAKGTILQMCPATARADALSAITLVDMIARLSTTTLFGIIFAAFADLGMPHLVFTCNAVSSSLQQRLKLELHRLIGQCRRPHFLDSSSCCSPGFHLKAVADTMSMSRRILKNRRWSPIRRKRVMEILYRDKGSSKPL